MYLLFTALYFTWLALQNLVIPLLYQSGVIDALTAFELIALKEVVLAAALILLAHRLFRRSWDWIATDKWAIAYVAVMTAYLVFGNLLAGTEVPWQLGLVNYRSGIAIVLFYFLGRLSSPDHRNFTRLLVVAVVLQVGASIFGFIEWGLLPDSFWRDTVGIGSYTTEVKSLTEGISTIEGLPGNLYRFDTRRMISTYAEPLAMGIACVFPLMLALVWAQERRKTGATSGWLWAASGVIGVALLLTVGRESIGVALAGILVIALISHSRYLVSMLLLAPLVVVLLAPSVVRDVGNTLTFEESSASMHLSFLATGWQQLTQHWLGEGLGTTGEWVVALTGEETDVRESTYLELLVQTGALGLATFMGFLLSLLRSCWRVRQRSPGSVYAICATAAIASLAGRLVTALFSPSLFAFIPLAIFFFACGAAITGWQRETRGATIRLIASPAPVPRPLGFGSAAPQSPTP